MASSDLMARLRYLNDAAHLVATAAPTTSRFLMSECNSIMFESGIDQPESHKREVCGACGTIMILGWNGKLEVASHPVRRGKGTPAKRTVDRARAIHHKCESCGRQIRIELPAPSSRHKPSSSSKTKHLSSIHRASTTPLLSSATPRPTSNTSSTPPAAKKRTKAKKSSGLEAVLARRRATESNRPTGLDLLDFMRKV